MRTFTVLGAGAMGSALCRPLAQAGWEVRLWGTWLDDDVLDDLEAGKPHPRTNQPLARGVRLYRSGQLGEALDGAEAVDMAVSSEGVPRVIELAAPRLSRAHALWMTSKGLWRDGAGRVHLLPDAMRTIAASQHVELPPLVVVGGPVKANECARGSVTATVFASTTQGLAARCARLASTSFYSVASSEDEVGVEVCAAFKNVYAIALGIADGLGDRRRIPFHNLKAAAFAQAVREMTTVATALGGHAETVAGLAGAGDLEVTGLSGRNKLYGARIGRGEQPQDALRAMERLHQTVEGAPTAPLAERLVEQRAPELSGRLPLLHAVNRILAGAESDPPSAVFEAVRPRGAHA